MVSGSLNVQSSEYAMIPPAVVFEMNGQGGGDSRRDIGPIGGSPDEGGDGGDNGDDGGDNGGDGIVLGLVEN
jgi:hypothetical protein